MNFELWYFEVSLMISSQMFCKSGAGASSSKESCSGLITESDDPTGDILDGRGPPLTQQDVENFGGVLHRSATVHHGVVQAHLRMQIPGHYVTLAVGRHSQTVFRR